MTISKRQYQGFGAAEFQRGYAAGLAMGKQQAKAESNLKLRENYSQLINSVGQAMQVNASMISGLAAVLDNGPRT